MLYRERLKQDLERRKAKNPRYSLSALARDIGLTPAAVSLVLSGRRHFSRRTLTAVAKLLNWSDADLSEALSEISHRPRKTTIRRDRLSDAEKAQVIILPALSDRAFKDFQDRLAQFVNLFAATNTFTEAGEIYAVVVQVISTKNLEAEAVGK